MQFEVKATGVTHRVSVPVAPPQGGSGGLAVRAAGACASSGGLEQTETYRVNNDPFTCCRKVTADRKGSNEIATQVTIVPNINYFIKLDKRKKYSPNCDASVRSHVSSEH